jgi:2-polyprenyl-3-methyl-5-hydroxy-6-metoxy-1,4-benzoquinol methylase
MGSTSSPSSADEPYDALASVYEWLVPDALLEPEGAVDAFSAVVGAIAPGARVLDCAAGTGQLAVGLALRGFEVTASDASAAMVERTRALAAERGVSLRTAACAWEELGRQGWDEPFEAVFCVGNSITHAEGRAGRRAALAAMAGLLAPGGLLALSSRNWELLRARAPGLEVADRLVERGSRRALLIRRWSIAERWQERHRLDVAVALLGDGSRVETHVGRLDFSPFTERELGEDLRAAGLEPVASTYAPEVERYLVTARRPGAGAGAGPARPAA